MPPKKAKTTPNVRNLPQDVGKHIASYLIPEFRYGSTEYVGNSGEMAALGRAHRYQESLSKRKFTSKHAKDLAQGDVQKAGEKLKQSVDKTVKGNYERNKDTMHAWLWDDAKRNDVRREYDEYSIVKSVAKSAHGMDLDVSTMMPI